MSDVPRIRLRYGIFPPDPPNSVNEVWAVVTLDELEGIFSTYESANEWVKNAVEPCELAFTTIIKYKLDVDTGRYLEVDSKIMPEYPNWQ